MPIANMYPCLDESGWETGSEAVATRMMAHFLTADYSQSYQNLGMVSSLGWLLKQYGNDPSKMRTNTQQALNTYFGKYFSNVDTTVFVEDVTTDSGKQKMTVDINLTDAAGVQFNLRRIIETTNNVITGMDAELIESYL